jgi:hypothetical protein
MKLRIHKHAVAWLGLVAMLLVVFAPLTCQLIASARAKESAGIVCSTGSHEHSAASHSTSHDQMDTCGYCSFFSHHVAAATIVAPPQALADAVFVAPRISEPNAFIPISTFPSGRPRDPPVTS